MVSCCLFGIFKNTQDWKELFFNLIISSRNVADLVKKEHFVLDSEYLVTMLVVVPLSNINDWNLKYEKLTDMIVPRSSQLIYQVCKKLNCLVLLITHLILRRTMTTPSCPSPALRKWRMNSSKKRGKTNLW